jgi:uncharacterized membrane protein YkvA (DUF1232 family)
MGDALYFIIGLVLATLLVALVAGGFLAWRVWRSDERRLAKRIGRLPFRDKLALGGALFRDPEVPQWARLLAVGLVLYLAMPLDLLPDFIPVIGAIDDLVIVLVGAGILIRSIPDYVLEAHIARLEAARGRPEETAK